MRYVHAAPDKIEDTVGTFLTKRMPPSASTVSPTYRETTVCYAYMCSYAYGCTEKTERAAQVLMRRCMRYLPMSMRIRPAVSEFSLDLLAKRRHAGRRLSPVTTGILDRVRPDGPIRKRT